MENNLESLKALVESDLKNIFRASEFSAECLQGDLKNFTSQSEAATNYPLRAGGKRVRPLLVHLFAESARGTLLPKGHSPFNKSRRAAAALELVHTYSLVHDDLPCMDNDDFRRGIPTTHKVYGEAKALLVGDGLLTKAFEILACSENSHFQDAAAARPEIACELVRILAACSGSSGMVLGQWLDLSFTDHPEKATWADLELIHRHKTGMLLAACCEMGLLCGLDAVAQFSVPEKFKEYKNPLAHPGFKKIRKFAQDTGFSAGLAFQIVDDILDATQPSHVLGKTAGKDSAQNKLTAVALLGMDGALQKAQECTQVALDSFHQMLALLAHIFPGMGASSEQEFTRSHLMTLDFLKSLLRRNF